MVRILAGQDRHGSTKLLWSFVILVFLLGCWAQASLWAQSTPLPPNYNVGSAMRQAAPPSTADTEAIPADSGAKPTLVVVEPEKPMALGADETLFVRKITVTVADVKTKSRTETDAKADDEAVSVYEFVAVKEVGGDDEVGVVDETGGDDEVGAAAETGLARIVAPYQNRELSMTDIHELARKVTRYYHNCGYIVAKAYVPKQDASSGVLEVRVTLGNYGSVALKNNSRLRDRVIEGELRHAKNSSPEVTSQSLERTMLLVRDMPGGAMPSVTLEPGKAPGTTDLQVKVDSEGHRYQGYLLGDNQGSRFTGRDRLFGEVDMNSPLGIADKLSVSGMLSEGEGVHNVRISYGLPLNYNGLRLTVAASRTRYALGGSYSALDATGSVSAIEGTFSYPLLRRHDSSIDLSLNIAHRDLHDDMNAVSVFNPRTANVGAVTLQRTKFGTVLGHRFYINTAATVTVGELNQEDASEAKLTGTNGDYEKLNVSLSAETPLYRALSARASLVMQKDLRVKYLDSSEQLFISGSGGVRAFVEGSSGDNGYIFTAEFPYTLPKLSHTRLQHTASVFFDSGGVRAEKNGTTLSDYVLNDVGAGYTSTLYPFYFKLQGVRVLGNIHSETDKTRMWLQMGLVF